MQSPVNSKKWAPLRTIKVVKNPSPNTAVSHSSTAELCIEDSVEVLEESQNITAIHTAVKIQLTVIFTFLIFSCCIYKAYPSASCMKINAADSLCLNVVGGFIHNRKNRIIIYKCFFTGFNSCDGVFGIKTGFTKKSGRCLVSAAKRDGVTLVAVTLNAPNEASWSIWR